MIRWIFVLVLTSVLACSVGDGDVGANDETMKRCWVEFLGPGAPIQCGRAEADVTGITWPSNSGGYTVDLEFTTPAAFAAGVADLSWLYELKDFPGPAPWMASHGIGCYFDRMGFLEARIVFFNVSTDGGFWVAALSPTLNLQVNTHYFIRFTCSFSLGNCLMQANINGTLYPFFPIGAASYPAVTSRTLRIAVRYDGDYFHGAAVDLYQFRLTFSVLSPVAFSDEMTGYPFAADANDVVRYNCDEGVGDILRDRANGYDATLLEPTQWDWHCQNIGYGEAHSRGRR